MGVADDELQWHNHRYPMASLCLKGGYSQKTGVISEGNDFTAYTRLKDDSGNAVVIQDKIAESSTCTVEIINNQTFRPGNTYSLTTDQYHLLSTALPGTVTLVFRGRSRNEKTRFLSTEVVSQLFERPRLEMSKE